MTRDISTDELAKLEKITSAKELIALAELARITAERRGVLEEISNLREQQFEPKTAAELAAAANWTKWRDQTIADHLVKLAAIEARHRIAAKACGRAVAENSVVDLLKQVSLQREKTKRSGPV